MLSVTSVTRITTVVRHLMLLYELEDYVVAFEVRGHLCAMDQEELAENADLATESARVRYVHGQLVPRTIFELGTSQLLVKCITCIGTW
jgi:hypothetical protein